MKKIITSILLMLFMGCSEESVSPIVSDTPGDLVNECLECFGDYHIDENGHCICD